jgi:hypothetical protein
MKRFALRSMLFGLVAAVMILGSAGIASAHGGGHGGHGHHGHHGHYHSHYYPSYRPVRVYYSQPYIYNSYYTPSYGGFYGGGCHAW